MALMAFASASVTAAQAFACEGAPSATKLTVEVRGVRSPKGEMVVTVYPDDPGRFLAHKGKLLRVRTPTKAPATSACFYLPKAAYYAVAVYHDENGDHDFNRTIVGLPAEGFAFSNDPSTKTGLPSFKSVRFEAKGGDTNIHVTLRYLK